MSPGAPPVSKTIIHPTPAPALRPAVFLDRDGVLIEEVHYLSDVSQVRLTPGASGAVAALNRAGWAVVVVTNQAGVARGYFPEERVREVHAHIDGLLAADGARVDSYYYCPHHPTAGIGRYRTECDCRKPAAGMLLAAAADLGLDLRRSWLVGDRFSDLEAGAQAGTRTVLVRTGYGAETVIRPDDFARLNLAGVADRLSAAVTEYGLDRGPPTGGGS